MNTLAQLGRFGVVGVVLNLALYGFYIVLTAAGLSPIAASTLAFAVGVPLSLTAHRRVTFRVEDISAARKAGFVALYIAVYAAQIGTLSGLHYGLGVPHPVAQAIAILVAALVTFTVQKRAIFQA